MKLMSCGYELFARMDSLSCEPGLGRDFSRTHSTAVSRSEHTEWRSHVSIFSVDIMAGKVDTAREIRAGASCLMLPSPSAGIFPASKAQVFATIDLEKRARRSAVASNQCKDLVVWSEVSVFHLHEVLP